MIALLRLGAHLFEIAVVAALVVASSVFLVQGRLGNALATTAITAGWISLSEHTRSNRRRGKGWTK